MRSRARSDKERKAMFGRLHGDGAFDHLPKIKIKEDRLIVKNEFANINPEAAFVATLSGGAIAAPTNRQLIYDKYANRVLDMDPSDNAGVY
jgi:hypothetical protein